MPFRSEMAVNAVAVRDRSSTWHKEKMASSPYWSSPSAWSQSLVRSAMEQKMKRTRDLIYNSYFLHQQNALLRTDLSNSLFLCHRARAEHHAEKRGNVDGEGWRQHDCYVPLEALICILI